MNWPICIRWHIPSNWANLLHILQIKFKPILEAKLCYLMLIAYLYWKKFVGFWYWIYIFSMFDKKINYELHTRFFPSNDCYRIWKRRFYFLMNVDLRYFYFSWTTIFLCVIKHATRFLVRLATYFSLFAIQKSWNIAFQRLLSLNKFICWLSVSMRAICHFESIITTIWWTYKL